jgi:integrase
VLALSAVFSHAVRLGKLRENPVQASGIARAAATAATRDEARSRRRKDFTNEELNAIFTSPIFGPGGWNAPRANFGAAWYWLPLLFYYTGARREELAQLLAGDVRCNSEGIAYINILASDDDDGLRAVKTPGIRRVIPLHHDLLGRGFVEYASRLPKEGQLFPLLKANPEGLFGANFGKHWARYLREVVGIRSPADPVHGFRHTFKTLCRSVGVPEDVQDAITGHLGSRRVARGYGSMPLSTMAKELAKFPRLPDVALDPRERLHRGQ